MSENIQQTQQPPINNINTDTTTTKTTASECITNQILSLSNENEINNIINLQTDILKKQYETNHMLAHFNDYSSKKFNEMSNDFEKHTKMLKDMKKDLDYIFKKTRNLQILLNDKFPIPGISDQYNNNDEDEDDE